MVCFIKKPWSFKTSGEKKKDKPGKSNKRSDTTTLEGVFTKKKKKKIKGLHKSASNVRESLSHHPNRSRTKGSERLNYTR